MLIVASVGTETSLARSATTVLMMVAAILVAAAPVLGLRWAVSAHASAQAQRTLDGVARRMLQHAEAVLIEAADAAAALARGVGEECTPAARARLARAVHDSTALRNAIVLDPAGRAVCAATEIPLNGLDRLAWRATRDRDLLLAAAPASPERRNALVLRRRAGARAVIIALAPDAHLADLVPTDWRADALGAVTLDDGTVLGTVPLNGEIAPSGEHVTLLSAALPSERFPLAVSLAVPVDVARSSVGPLATLVDLGGGLVGLAFVILVLQAARRPRSVYEALEHGIRRREFVPFYQPVFQIQTGRLVGCEVLVRWRRKDGSIVPPGAFIAQAEESGLAVEMTRQLMAAARDEMAEAYRARPELKLAFNLFADHFSDLSLVDEVRETFRAGGVRYSQIVFEITERYPLPNLNRAKVAISGLQALGCRVALDDAGTGHGGLAYLQTLGIDQIKIDKLFIDSITVSSASAPIVDSLIELGRSLGMEIVAEGVETTAQLQYLKARGVHCAQGYLFAKPLPGPAYLELIEGLAAPPVESGDGATAVASAA
jgi:sensor c-di-GMP phosphodiesterase-like protein